MSLVINTNTQSIFAQRALRANTLGLQRNIERLSTGYRINRAADDAAGLSIANKLSTQIRGLEKAKQNMGDGISLLQTLEGGLQIVQQNLQRIRELVVQGSNGTNGTNEKDALQREINERIAVIDDISGSTKFNGISLLRPTANITLQTGSNNGETTTITLLSTQPNEGVNIDVLATSADGELSEGSTIALAKLRLAGSSVRSYDNTPADAGSVADVDSMIDNLSRMRSYIGAMQNSLESKLEYADIAIENASASRSRIQDVDVAKESSSLVRNQILQQTAAAMLSQANLSPQLALSLLPQ